MTFAGRWSEVLAELRAVFERVDPAQVERLQRALLEAERIFVTGQGRSGLMARALAIRLMHIGFAVHIVGEATTPAIGADDLLVAVSASGRTAMTASYVQAAHAAGARVAAIGARRAASPDDATLVDLGVHLPIGGDSGVATRQHAGSLFEQAALVLFDTVCALLQEARGQSDAQLSGRHANLQ